MNADEQNLPLRGIRVIDLTWVGAGPFTTKILADFGAEVIKVESATRPDQLRRAEPLMGKGGLEESGYFANRNSNKKSITLNMKTPEARDVVLRLIERADVLANSFSSGVMDRLGLGYAVVAARNPSVVYLSMPLAEPDGPYASYLGYGMNIAALVGMTHIAAEPGRHPIGTGTNCPDHLPNPLHAAFAVLAALRNIRRGGSGQEIVVPQITSTLSMFPEPVLAYANNKTVLEPAGSSAWDAAPRNAFPCAGHDRWCAIAVHDDAGFAALCRVMGRPQLAQDARYARMGDRRANRASLEAEVAEWTRSREAEAIERSLQEAGVHAAVVANAEDLVAKDEHLRERSFWQYLDHAVMGRTLYHGVPARFSRIPTAYRRAAPMLGEHNAEICALAGLGETEYDDLAAKGVFR
jgi:benzylsuccinate CoA-transferase BbsF subunit